VSLIDESQIRVILLDIEGTTTPVEFVYQTLFPYASRKLESFLREHSQDPEIHSLIQDLRAQHQVDERNGLEPPGWLDDAEEARLRSSVAYGQWLIARDSKCTPLKSLQGRIWQQGLRAGNCTVKFFPMCPSHSNDGGGRKKSSASTRREASSRSNSCFALRPRAI